MFQHIMRCGVIGAAPEHQAEWFAETMAYLAERYPELAENEVGDLRTLGERFVQPPKQREATEGETAENAESEPAPEAEASAA